MSRTIVRAYWAAMGDTSGMSTWAQSAEERRRDRFAYWVTEQRLAEWTVRAVITRAALACAALAAVIGAALTGLRLPW